MWIFCSNLILISSPIVRICGFCICQLILSIVLKLVLCLGSREGVWCFTWTKLVGQSYDIQPYVTYLPSLTYRLARFDTVVQPLIHDSYINCVVYTVLLGIVEIMCLLHFHTLIPHTEFSRQKQRCSLEQIKTYIIFSYFWRNGYVIG